MCIRDRRATSSCPASSSSSSPPCCWPRRSGCTSGGDHRNMQTPRDALIAELTALILEATDKRLDGAPLAPDEALFGPESRLALDSLDALQVSMALLKRYRVRLVDSKETRRILSCVGNLADHMIDQKKA